MLDPQHRVQVMGTFMFQTRTSRGAPPLEEACGTEPAHAYALRPLKAITNSKPWSRLAENGFSYVRTCEVQVLEWGQD